jgi:hypothetical protein
MIRSRLSTSSLLDERLTSAEAQAVYQLALEA